MPNNFFIVEGKSEYEFLSRVIARFYAGKKNIQIIYAEGDHDKQRETMEGINRVFVPLFANPVYKDRLVILCDTPNQSRSADFDNFKKSYDFLEKGGQISVIPQCHLEEYYPTPWKKTTDEIKAMSKDKNAKLLLARNAGDAITKEQFEGEMKVMLDALEACWTKAY